MTEWLAPDSEDVTQWLGENHPEYQLGQPAPIPEFKFVTASIKWGDEPDRVNTAALKILCAEKDGMYVKTLFARAYKCKGCPRGLFLPARGWLVTTAATYKVMLKQHNKYLIHTKAIAIEGLHIKVLKKEITVEQETVSVCNYLLKKSKVIKSIE
eukprot:4639749-Ditylum_brightwellii.AAC.1